MIKDDTMTP